MQRTVKKIFRPCLFKERKKKTKPIFSHVPKGEIRNGAGAGLTCRTSLFKYCFAFFKRTKAKGKAGKACSLRHPRRREVAGLPRSPENCEKSKTHVRQVILVRAG